MWLNKFPLIIRDFSEFHSYPHNNIQRDSIYSFDMGSLLMKNGMFKEKKTGNGS
jgi:hypothetical protein